MTTVLPVVQVVVDGFVVVVVFLLIPRQDRLQRTRKTYSPRELRHVTATGEKQQQRPSSFAEYIFLVLFCVFFSSATILSVYITRRQLTNKPSQDKLITMTRQITDKPGQVAKKPRQNRWLRNQEKTNE